MKNSKALYYDLINRASADRDVDEITEKILRAMENVLGLTRIDVMTDKPIDIAEDELRALEKIVVRLNNHEPIQYILGEADFYSRKFYVDQSVLIPRPETEEMVSMLVNEFKDVTGPRIVDVGTGSGCIAITLALELDGSNVIGTDVSKSALAVASRNAASLGADVEFMEQNILRQDLFYERFDLVVSNPPYIAISEKQTMQSTVFDFEPELALFVPDDDPLMFYRALAMTSIDALVANGMLAVEINERFGREVAELFEQRGLSHVKIFRDIFGKDRFVSGRKIAN